MQIWSNFLKSTFWVNNSHVSQYKEDIAEVSFEEIAKRTKVNTPLLTTLKGVSVVRQCCVITSVMWANHNSELYRTWAWEGTSAVRRPVIGWYLGSVTGAPQYPWSTVHWKGWACLHLYRMSQSTEYRYNLYYSVAE